MKKIYVIKVETDVEVAGFSDIEQALEELGVDDIELIEEYND